MNVLLNPIGSHGDVHPFIGLGIELKRRGHRVTVITSGHFESLARAAGLEFVAVGTDEEFRRVGADPDLWHPTRGPKTVFQKAVLPQLDQTCDALGKLYVPGETIVAASSLGFAARIFQDATNVPTATIHLSPICFRSIIEPPLMQGMPMPRFHWGRRVSWWIADRLIIDPMVSRAINRKRRSIGLPKVHGILKDWWHSPTLTIGMFPDWFAPPQPDWPPQAVLTGFPLYDERGLTPLPPALETFLQSGDAPIAFTPGSAMLHGHEFFEAATAACQKLNRRGVLLTRHRDQIPQSLPKSVIHIDYVPFSELLPKCAAIVHHGGIGTTAQSLAAGTLQVIVPMSHDQFDNAARVKRLGVGTSVPSSKCDANTLTHALGPLLVDETARAAASIVAKRFENANAIATTVDHIESLAAKSRP